MGESPSTRCDALIDRSSVIAALEELRYVLVAKYRLERQVRHVILTESLDQLDLPPVLSFIRI